MKKRIYKKYFYTLSHHILDDCHFNNESRARKDAWKLAQKYIPFTSMGNFAWAINLLDAVIDYQHGNATMDDIREYLIAILCRVDAWHHKKIF